MDCCNHRILIIDDNRAIHEDFRKILVVEVESAELDCSERELFGTAPSAPTSYELDSAYQGEDGYQMVVAARESKRPYALAFVDMRMPPGWDGLQTVDNIWTADPDIQIVICSAFSDHAWTEIRSHFGASDRLLILKKPFEPVEVSQMACALSTKWHHAKTTKAQIMQMKSWVALLGANAGPQKA